MQYCSTLRGTHERSLVHGEDEVHRERPTAGAPDVFAADEVIGRDLARVDWAATPLGAPDTWPQSLKTAVSLQLSSKFSMWMAWGPELTFFCNAAYRRDTLDQKYPWALGRPASEVWAEVWDDIESRIDTVLTSGEATWDQGLLLFLERSGYTEESYHTFSYSPLRDDEAGVVGLLCVVSEDTGRIIGERRMSTLRDLGSVPSFMRTEQEMLGLSSEQLGRNLQDLPFTLIYLFDEDGDAHLASSTGFPEDHPLLVRRLSAAAADPWPLAAIDRGEPVLIDLLAASLHGLPTGAWPDAPSQALALPLLRQGGTPYGFLVTGLNRYRPLDEGYRGFLELVAGHLAARIAGARSYRAQERRAEELAELDRAKTTFFSNISHEFRTPLTLILGQAQELGSQLGETSPDTSESLEVIRRNGLRLGKLVNTLLDFSRIEAGRMQASYRPTDLSAATAELASVFRSAIDRAGLRFVVDCESLPHQVFLDWAMWEKIILNLLSNALKFTFDGTVRVTVRDGEAEALVTVADTGVGIAAAEMPRLFERFHRIENSESRSNEGSGIGLALVKELVGLHGGQIRAESTEGQGTSFTIALPYGAAHLPGDSVRAEPAIAATSSSSDPFIQEALRWMPGDGVQPLAESTANPVAQSGVPARVLLCDDNADMREYLDRLLRGAGYQVSIANDGQDALEAARREPPDVVVSDVMMPRLDGLGLVGALREDGRTAAIPVLLLSARAGEEASIEGLQAGADDYLVKPFSAAELLARVRANIEMARLRSDHARWRTALIESLQEAFFVCDDQGAVIEINAAFSQILGYGAEGLPYRPIHPWWPDAATDAEAHQLVQNAFALLLGSDKGSYTIPVTRRDGRRLWVTATFSRVGEPRSDRQVIVGTFRDVTADHYAIQRESAIATITTRLSRSASSAEALAGVLAELKTLWRAELVLAAVFPDGDDPAVTSTEGEVTWERLAPHHGERLTAARSHSTLTPVVDDTGVDILLEHPEGQLAVRIELGGHRVVTEEDRTLLSLLAGHIAHGLHRVHQSDQQRTTAIALQRSILGPSVLPAGFAVRYEPATQPLEVGGDWYDTVELPGGRIGIVVGDCVGRGLKAATVMGQLRSACRALLLQDTDPAQTLMALDQFAAGVPGAACTTVFCGVLNVETGELVYSSAGHPPGILAKPDGTTSLLVDGHSLPLAVRPGRERSQGSCVLPARSTLMLYTDGLVERRRRPLSDGLDRAGEVLRGGGDITVEDLATTVMDRLVPGEGFDDDVALLLYRHPAPLKMTFPAESSQLAMVRKSLRSWLHQCQLPPATIQNVLVAVGEACANAIEHGHRDTPGELISLHAEARAGDLHLNITDAGRWKQPEADPNRGRGLNLMQALMQRVTVIPRPSGTTVDLHARIS
ncbi:response regulator [Pseudonocardiaceae bacterium YIM PH 21723]|nr:response regulator [Pseudonocardiaceae bacterium YIM PH 21723]